MCFFGKQKNKATTGTPVAALVSDFSALKSNSLNPCSDLVVTHIIAFLESVNTSACIDELLLARKERVAVGANIDSEVFAGGASFKRCAASTFYNDGLIVGMDSLLHNILSPLSDADTT